METIVNVAVVGTGQQHPTITTGTPIDALVAQLANEQPERKLLLAAGALSLYRQAGQSAELAPIVPEPAPPETLAPCSARVVQILANLYQSRYNDDISHNAYARLAKEQNPALVAEILAVAKILTQAYPGQYNEIISEAYTLLANAHQRLPHDVLTAALAHATENTSLRASLLPVLGERGHWLSQFNPAWSWVAQVQLEVQYIAAADLETVWQEGTLAQRTEVLYRVRAVDPAQALAWLTAVWKQEKADARFAFLVTLEVGLSMQDHALLAQALEDRVESVRVKAASLMVRLTDSPQVQRLIKRADELLEYNKGKISVVLTTTIDKAWARDVTMLKPSSKIPPSSFYRLEEVVARVPPTHWEERFSLTPTQILKAFSQTDGVHPMLDALVKAALLHNSTNWFCPLLDAQPDTDDSYGNARPALLARLPQHEAERRIRSALISDDRSFRLLSALPRPWSEEFGERALQLLKYYYELLDKHTHVSKNWESIIDTFAVSLPPSCFDAAVSGWERVDDKFYLGARIDPFLQKINLRKLLIEEIR